MDVTCNRCGTVYEFEEALISTTGTTVKCTQCGHLFKVHRPSSSPPADDSDSHSLRWRIRRVDGSTHTLESLIELTPLIGAGQFTRDDEISRTGQVWKKLGDIQELASVFEPAPRPRRTSDMALQPPPPPPPQSNPPPKGDEAAAGASSAVAESAASPRSRRPTSDRFHVMGTEVAIDSSRPPPPRAEFTPSTEPAAAATPARTKPPAPPPPPPATAATQAESAEPDSDSAQTLNRPPAPSTETDLEAPQPAGARTSRLWPWLLAVGISLALAAGIGGTLFERSRPPEREDPARAFLARGDQALVSHLTERFDEAVSEYSKALGYHRDDAHILSSISRVYAVWAQWQRDRAHGLQAAAVKGAELEAVEREMRELADQAKLYGERAAQRNPGNEEASVALSDALRLTGNLVAARSELDRARATEGVASAETLRVAALLAIDEANGDLRAGRGLAEQAVARDPTLLRARVLLAQCLAQDGDFAGAHMHLDAARGRGKAHTIIDQASAEIDRAERLARGIAAQAAGTAGAPALPAVAAAQPPPAAPKPKPAEPPTDGKPEPSTKTQPAAKPQAAAKPSRPPADEPSKGDPDELVSKGETALERGQVRSAERLFEQALELDPGMPRARTGLGYVALERSQPRQAINQFRPAARGGNPEALIGLGDAYRRLGRMKEALGAYREYLERYPRGERSSIAQRQVELLTEQLQDNP